MEYTIGHFLDAEGKVRISLHHSSWRYGGYYHLTQEHDLVGRRRARPLVRQARPDRLNSQVLDWAWDMSTDQIEGGSAVH